MEGKEKTLIILLLLVCAVAFWGTAGPVRRMRVSICDDIFHIDRRLHSNIGFQQLALVCDSKAGVFFDKRRFVRRSICKNGDEVFILQSRFPMTLTAFAKECARVSTDAAYLDMGSYGFVYRAIEN